MKEQQHLLKNPAQALEDWIESLTNLNYVEMNVMPQGTLEDYQPDRFLRNLDPESFLFQFLGTTSKLREITAEIQKVELKCQKWSKTHNPW